MSTVEGRVGQGRPSTSAVRERLPLSVQPRAKRAVASMFIREGDLVVDESDGSIGLLVSMERHISRGTPVVYRIELAPGVHTGWRCWRTIRQATQEEIAEAGMEKIDCNMYRGR